jgi:hypothetical protein
MMSPAAERRSGRQGLSKDARTLFAVRISDRFTTAKKVMKRSNVVVSKPL